MHQRTKLDQSQLFKAAEFSKKACRDYTPFVSVGIRGGKNMKKNLGPKKRAEDSHTSADLPTAVGLASGMEC
jgi:hypothetical protein